MAGSSSSKSSLCDSFLPLPHPCAPTGKVRKTGFELEFASVDIARCADDVVSIFGGTALRKNSMLFHVSDTIVGDFRIELDAVFAQKIAAQLETPSEVKKPSPPGESDIKLRTKLSEWLHKAAAEIIPLEIVSPPISEKNLPKLEELRLKLHNDNAQGTGAGIFYGFGMHINPEIHSSDTSEILDIMRAFVLLYPWLKSVLKVDLSRRVTHFIDPFPVKYAQKITSVDYAPSLKELMEEYVADNPTRNRALDLLPLFSHLEPAFFKTLPLPENEKLNSRPTFHYRLPNCELDNPHWCIARDWNSWVRIEELAADKKTLKQMMQSYQNFLENQFFPNYSGWITILGEEYGYQT